MALDLSLIGPDARARFVNLGRQWGSGDTLAQAMHTINALERRGPALVAHGFTAEDAANLLDMKQRLEAAGVTREAARTGKKTTNKDHHAACTSGKLARLAAHRALQSGIGAASRTGGVPEGVLTSMRSVIGQTSRAGSDGAALATQLELLASTLGNAGIATALASRGGPEAARSCTSVAAAIRASLARTATAAGTPAETEMLDLIDGIIVELCREARAAARNAASMTGEEAIAKEFALTELERAAGKPKEAAAPAKG
jgi:hypothetical protein